MSEILAEVVRASLMLGQVGEGHVSEDGLPRGAAVPMPKDEVAFVERRVINALMSRRPKPLFFVMVSNSTPEYAFRIYEQAGQFIAASLNRYVDGVWPKRATKGNRLAAFCLLTQTQAQQGGGYA